MFLKGINSVNDIYSCLFSEHFFMYEILQCDTLSDRVWLTVADKYFMDPETMRAEKS